MIAPACLPTDRVAFADVGALSDPVGDEARPGHQPAAAMFDACGTCLADRHDRCRPPAGSAV
jgi:hypothetical protein